MGTAIKAGESSTESKLLKFLNEGKINTEDKTQGWITLDRLFFKTGTSDLSDESNVQLSNIVTIFKNFPKASFKIGGYTDNVGAEETNMALSQTRAEVVYNQLKTFGFNSDRMKAEGYGSQHPVCPENNSDICKAQNRRIDIRITNK